MWQAQARTSSPGGRSRPTGKVTRPTAPNVPSTRSHPAPTAPNVPSTRSHPAHSSDVNAPIPVTYIELSTEHRYITHTDFLPWPRWNRLTRNPTLRVGPELQPSAHSRVLSPPTRTHHGMYLGDAISRKTSTDKVHAIAHRPRCNLQDG